MTAQLILLGTRRDGGEDDFAAYASVAGPLLMAAGGTWNGKFDRLDDLAGEGPEQVRIMEFPDEGTIRAVFESAEYQNVNPSSGSSLRRAPHHRRRYGTLTPGGLVVSDHREVERSS